ncbi:MAG: putative toxin-antitoxin system toxin component, PIN family [Saprospiraceae bacterium]|nr:putative toxin-antitoxin system toxin component, PIN family [Pyrinomonadaceae bacterium]
MRVVFDTNVLVAAARSQGGASFALVSMLPTQQFELAISIPLYLEYLDVLQPPANIPANQTPEDVLGFIRKLLGYSHKQRIYFGWRPALKDPNDDFVLELAIASQSSYIVTFNAKDFINIELFGIETISPADFLKMVRKI